MNSRKKMISLLVSFYNNSNPQLTSDKDFRNLKPTFKQIAYHRPSGGLVHICIKPSYYEQEPFPWDFSHTVNIDFNS